MPSTRKLPVRKDNAGLRHAEDWELVALRVVVMARPRLWDRSLHKVRKIRRVLPVSLSLYGFLCDCFAH